MSRPNISNSIPVVVTAFQRKKLKSILQLGALDQTEDSRLHCGNTAKAST